jgi:hypothetical protein
MALQPQTIDIPWDEVIRSVEFDNPFISHMDFVRDDRFGRFHSCRNFASVLNDDDLYPSRRSSGAFGSSRESLMLTECFIKLK